MIEIGVFVIIIIGIILGVFHWFTDGDSTRFLLKSFKKNSGRIAKRDTYGCENSSDSNMGKYILFGIVAFIICIIIGTSMITIVPAGSVGVKDTFGSVDKDVFQSGLHFKSPFTGVVMMSTQTQKYMDYGTSDVATIQGLSNEGLPVGMGIAVNYHLNPDKASDVYKSVGANYPNIVLVNPVHSVPRDIIAQYDVKTLYSASAPGSPDRVKVESQLFDGISTGVDKVGVPDAIVIEQVYIRNIDLPQQLKDAIANKLTAEQKIQEKDFQVRVQEKESNRMRVEAQGIADANRIIAGSLTPAYLEWATIEMQKSHTGATYFIPTDMNGRANPGLVMPLSTVAIPNST